MYCKHEQLNYIVTLVFTQLNKMTARLEKAHTKNLLKILNIEMVCCIVVLKLQ